MTIHIGLSITSKHSEKLTKLKEKSKINKSMLFRMFIDYFDKHPNEFKKLREGNYGFE